MTTEEAISAVERVIHTELKWPGTEETVEALRMAVATLREKQERELNGPLTLDELSESAEKDWRAAADVARVRYGQWESWRLIPAGPVCKCLVCGDYALMTASVQCSRGKASPRLNYCPNCGAKMDGGKATMASITPRLTSASITTTETGGFEMLKKGTDYRVEGYTNLWSIIDTYRGYGLLENCTFGDETCYLVVKLAQKPVEVSCRNKATGETVTRQKITHVVCETFDGLKQALIDEGLIEEETK